MASVYKRGGKRAKGTYFARWKDQNNKWRNESTGTTDKAAAQRIANKLAEEAALRRDGVIDAAQDAIAKQSKKSIEDHLADFENVLRSKSRSDGRRRSDGRKPYDDHIVRTLKNIRAIAKFTRAVYPSDLTTVGRSIGIATTCVTI